MEGAPSPVGGSRPQLSLTGNLQQMPRQTKAAHGEIEKSFCFTQHSLNVPGHILVEG
jgi:hypothetical protein